MGVGKLGLGQRPRALRMKQAVAAVGQCELMHIYDKFFGEYGATVAQILLTDEDVDDPAGPSTWRIPLRPCWSWGASRW